MNLLLIFAIIVSVFSQIEPIAPVFRPLMYVSWPLSCFCAILTFKRIRISKFTTYFAFTYLLFIIYCLACYAVGAENTKSYYLQILYIPLMLCLLADFCSDRISKIRFQRLCKIYVWVSFLFALWVNLTYFRSYGSWLSSMGYDFSQKNSAAQIWGMAILVNVFLIQHKTVFSRRLAWVISFYFMFLILLSHCRTALLGLGIVLFCNIVYYSKNRILWIIALLIGAHIVFTLPSFHNFINHSLLFTKYEGAELDAFSSGRLGYYSIAWNVFLSSPLIGVGKYYVDCSYLSILTENGIIGFILIESIWIYKVIIHFFTAFKNRFNVQKKEQILILRFLVSVIIFYLIESILEGFPPFGPGVSSMAFWLFSGILLRRKDWIC